MTDTPTAAPASQTLSRGIRILEELADARVPLAVDDLARRLGVHRSIAYRLLRTLDDHGLVMRETDGRYALGARLAAQDTWSLLVIFQAMDAAGKDGTIRHVMSGVNPQGVEVTSFKVPSDLERDHDYLWRSALRLPRRGDIGIFNRSYYEECLVVRVHPEILRGQRMPAASKGKDVWQRRFREINDWERYLTDFPDAADHEAVLGQLRRVRQTLAQLN